MDGALLTLIVAAPFALATAYSDLKTMEIASQWGISTAVAFLGLVFATLPMGDALFRVGAAFAILIVLMLLFFVGGVAGGDAKAMATFALLVAPIDAGFVLLLLSVNGLVMLAVISLLRRTRLAGGEWKFWSAERRFPYGVALCATLLIYLSLVATVV